MNIQLVFSELTTKKRQT